MDNEQLEENSQKEEWGGWKIVSNMLDNPDETGIYPTSKCYQELYEFVVSQKVNQKQYIKKMLEERLLIKCECENGDCPNCKRLCEFLDDLK